MSWGWYLDHGASGSAGLGKGGVPDIWNVLPGYIDHQSLSFDAYLKFIEDDFLNGQRLDPKTGGRPDSRPMVRENDPQLGGLRSDLDFSQTPRAPLVLPVQPKTSLIAPTAPQRSSKKQPG